MSRDFFWYFFFFFSYQEQYQANSNVSNADSPSGCSHICMTELNYRFGPWTAHHIMQQHQFVLHCGEITLDTLLLSCFVRDHFLFTGTEQRDCAMLRVPLLATAWYGCHFFKVNSPGSDKAPAITDNHQRFLLSLQLLAFCGGSIMDNRRKHLLSHQLL